MGVGIDVCGVMGALLNPINHTREDTKVGLAAHAVALFPKSFVRMTPWAQKRTYAFWSKI